MHHYDLDVVQEVDASLDFDDDNLFECAPPFKNEKENRASKLLQSASYAYDCCKFNRCLSYIKEYENEVAPLLHLPSSAQAIVIHTYKAHCKKSLKLYDSAIAEFDIVISHINSKNLSQECNFMTHLEKAYCYLLKGDKRGFKHRIEKLFDMGIAPTYDYYVEKGFKIYRQPCFHDHAVIEEEAIVFDEIAPFLLGREVVNALTANKQTPKFFTIKNNDESVFSCRRMCHRATNIMSIIISCITKKATAGAACLAIGELLVDCEVCCEDGWGSENCCKTIKAVFWNACQQHLLDDL